jgi:hypothetical protein
VGTGAVAGPPSRRTPAHRRGRAAPLILGPGATRADRTRPGADLSGAHGSTLRIRRIPLSPRT